ncbi:MAG TPA: acyltransferase [Mycobacteriales bacterium]|nr:acyltransferase [Mycobacteriales bacterium]
MPAPRGEGALRRQARLWREEPIHRVAVRARLMRPLRVRQLGAFGPASILDRPAWLYGSRHVSIGAGAIILRGGWIAVERSAWSATEPVLRIGDRVAIRMGVTISAAASIVIEDDVGMGAYVTIIDSKHTWAAGDPNALHGPLESAPIRIGRGTWLADRVTVAPGADIGEQCAIGPNSVVSAKVPDFSVVVGNPGRVVGTTRPAAAEDGDRART